MNITVFQLLREVGEPTENEIQKVKDLWRIKP